MKNTFDPDPNLLLDLIDRVISCLSEISEHGTRRNSQSCYNSLQRGDDFELLKGRTHKTTHFSSLLPIARRRQSNPREVIAFDQDPLDGIPGVTTPGHSMLT